jgi:hypothetical protein
MGPGAHDFASLMKRMVLALLAVFCAAVVQVQPVEPLKTCPCDCCHCKHPGECGMPACRSSSTASPTVATAQSVPNGRSAPRLLAQPGPFLASFVFAPGIGSAPSSALTPSALAVPTAHVPLFKAHCSFLI